MNDQIKNILCNLLYLSDRLNEKSVYKNFQRQLRLLNKVLKNNTVIEIKPQTNENWETLNVNWEL